MRIHSGIATAVAREHVDEIVETLTRHDGTTHSIAALGPDILNHVRGLAAKAVGQLTHAGGDAPSGALSAVRTGHELLDAPVQVARGIDDGIADVVRAQSDLRTAVMSFQWAQRLLD
jgi:hypothetical protein